MVLEFYSQNKKLLFAIFGLVLIIGISYSVLSIVSNNKEPASVFCTMDAKLCPDGSYVGRIGPNCEFATCPVEVITDETLGWIIFADEAQDVSFRYPDSFNTTYMRAFDWPPQVQIINELLECIEAGSEIDRAGRTEKNIINGREYCVTKQTEGAVGSIYTQYAYAVQKDKKTVIFTFSTRATQCGNYDEPQKIECENERVSFDINDLIDRIAETFRFSLVDAGENLVAQLDKCLGKTDVISKEKCAVLFKMITNYDECVAAAFPLVGSPPKCKIPDGRIFSP